ncbi:Dna-mediated transposase [Oopsacas minuta]|uniref:Dna-mediated transposase n=1 Tax=Oopsacas minuta TaxID=111878 RepID=A0AAV7JWS8_9METZ|nr:Dna-mediated transposase [Oopsacas minuta]
MAKILSGAGGANCQMFTATFQQIHDISIVQNGFPINRIIRDVRDVFDEVDEEELSLPTNQRCFTRSDDTLQDFLYWVLTVVPQETHQVVTTIINNLSAILRLYNSNRKVDTEGLDNVCRETYESILTNFSWAHVTPTLHKLLAHAPQIIADHNDGFGLEDLSEEGLESWNKLVGRYRERLSRKFSFEDNVEDVFVRLISQSDPILASFRNITKNDSEPDLSELKSCQDIW